MIGTKGKIYGHVQGVFFRKYIREKARELNIKGFVRNEPDGTVYFEVEGLHDDIEKFKRACHQGPSGSKVLKFETEEIELKYYRDFKIEY